MAKRSVDGTREPARDVEDAYRAPASSRSRTNGQAEVSGGVDDAPPIPCPEDGCSTRFTCDACFDEHLRSVHGATYAGVFGDVPTAWLVVCRGHEEFPLGRLTAME